MNEIQAQAENTPAAKNLPVPDRRYSLPAKRLSGSIDCLNCGTGLQGPFCHFCGQPDKNLVRFFPALLRELLEDFLDFDSRFMRTLKPLLFRPGKLTRDYLDGKRFRYVPPLRLYIFSSIAFFFLAALFTADSIQVNSAAVDEDGDNVVTGIHIGDTEEEAKEDGADEEGEHEHDHELDLSFNGEPWDKETNPLIIPLMPEWVNDWVNDEIEQSPQKGREIEKNPDLITEKVFDLLPATMFVLLPIVALLFKFWYAFAKKYYLEHLIFALHNHAFIFVLILIAMLLTAFVGWREPAGEGPLNTALIWANIVIYSWIPLYLLLSLKRVYQQGWGMTLVKYSVIGISYLALLLLATVFVALLSFVLL